MLTIGKKISASSRGVALTIWTVFRDSQIWRVLRRVAFLRSGVYLAIELWRWSSNAKEFSKEAVDCEFRLKEDPFQYMTSPSERLRFDQQAKLLDSIRNGRRFQRALEIRCAQGIFTEMLAERSKSL